MGRLVRCKTCNKRLAEVATKGTIIICYRCKTENIVDSEEKIYDKASTHVDKLEFMN